jgi:hypothetical protein
MEQIIFLLSEAFYELVLLPVILLLLLPFIMIASLFGNGGFLQNMRSHTKRIWGSMRRGSFFDLLASLRRQRRSSREGRGIRATG